MIPWFKGYKGKIEFVKSGTYRSVGSIEYEGENTLVIRELPIYEWTCDYKSKLEKMIEKEEIEDFKEYHSETNVHFVISITDEQKKKLGGDLIKAFKLSSNINLTNMTCHDANGHLKKYLSTQQMIKDFYEKIIELYQKRKNELLRKIQKDFDIFDNKVRFILAVLSEEIIVKKRKKDDLLKELKDKGFTPINNSKKLKKKKEEDDEDDEEDQDEKELSSNSYDYLLGMALWSLTMERVEKLKKIKMRNLKSLRY